MSYQEDTIDWQAMTYVDAWLDNAVQQQYKNQPLAQDWARISKVAEELGEAIQAFIGYTGQNPRKGIINDIEDVLDELADTALTAMLAMLHFTKNSSEVCGILEGKIARIERRAREAT